MKKVLLVVTNSEKFGTYDRATGLWLSEAAHFNNVMDDYGITVDYVSPSGGYVPIDPNSLTSDTFDEGCWKYYGDAHFRNDVLGQSKNPEEVNAEDYMAIYYAGGHGAIWDFPDNTTLGTIASTIAKNGGVVAAVCHGVVGLLAIRNDDGSYFIDRKKLTGFSNAEETLNGLEKKVPYLTEDALKNAGGIYSCGAPYTDYTVVDGNLITGENPQSAKSVGDEVVNYLKAHGLYS